MPEFEEPYSIYRFRDGEFVLYVSKTSRNILERLFEHIGIDGQTQMTTLIEDNLRRCRRNILEKEQNA